MSSSTKTYQDDTGDYIVEIFEVPDPKAVVVCAAGFGMNRYDGHALFKDVAESLNDYTRYLVDLNQVSGGALTANPLSVQVNRFNTILAEARTRGLPVILIGHSMGCIVISQANTQSEPTIFLAPAVRDIHSKLQSTLLGRPQTTELPDGTMKAGRSDGSITTIPKQFWDEVKGIDLRTLYAGALMRSSIALVVAGQDQLLKAETHDVLDLPFKQTVTIVGADHDFSGSARPELITTITKLIEEQL